MTAAPPPQRTPFLGILPWPERRAVAEALRTETIGGLVLLAAAVIALIWANSPLGDLYRQIRDVRFGIPALGLDLSVGHWTADGLLTVFFLVAGIELKRELVVGELRTPATAALPVVAALCGMAVPAALYALTASLGGGGLDGWAVPMATDIAFALAVLAVISTHLPAALRAFLLTLAVVDDLGAILIIAIFFTADLNFLALGSAFAGLVVFYALQRRRVRGWWWYVPLGITVWALMYNSGVHATVAGVAMGLILRTTLDKGEAASPGARVSHLVHPFSAGVAVPLFALFAAGVTVSGSALADVFTRPEPLGVVIGLVVGKILGVFGGTYLAARFTRARLNPDLAWADVFGLAVLAGIGFTVALLIGELAFPGQALTEQIKAAVLVGSVTAATLAALLLRRRNKVYKRLYEEEALDADADGVPDIYQRGTAEGGKILAAVICDGRALRVCGLSNTPLLDRKPFDSMAPMRRHDHTGPMALRAMQDLATRTFPATGYRHIGDLTWNWTLSLDRGDECPTAVWTEGDRTLAWGWLELPDSLMLQVDPDRAELAHDVLSWAEQAARGPLHVEVAGTESHLVKALEQRGYIRAVDGPFMACLERDLTELPDTPPLPDGYAIRAQHDDADVAGRAAAHRAAFGSTRITTERHARMRDAWPYRPELDLVVTSPAGDVVAYCQGWYDPVNAVGTFEPVGTHPDHRRLGLARAVCTAVLHAFARAGGRRAIVYSRGDAAYPVPKRLYESMGFTTYTRTHTFLGRPTDAD